MDRTNGRRPRLTDGGRRTPGVPDVASSDDEESSTERASSDSSDSSDRRDSSSGDPMPGVPDVGDAQTEPESDGESRGSSTADDPEPEHDLTTAFTLSAIQRARTPSSVVAAAKQWSDWVGVVGDVSGPELNAFFRSHSIDVDFFNDVSDEPAERLAKIEEGHHFYSDRRVLVGRPEEKEWAEAAGWEFQPIEGVAAEANWTLEDE